MKTILPLLFLLLPFFCAAGNLFPEWEKERKEDDKSAPEGWRFSHWGSAKPSVHQWKTVDDHLVLHWKGADEKGMYVLIRRIALTPEKDGKLRHFRFSATAKSEKSVLVQLSLSGSLSATKSYFNTTAESKSYSIDFVVPPQEKQLTAMLLLCGTNEAVFSDLRLEELPEVPQVQVESNLFGRTFEIGEKVPGTAVLDFSHLPPDGKVKLTLRLPRGYRLSNNSWGSIWRAVRPLPGGESEYDLCSSPYTGGKWRLMLLLESLLPPSQEALQGKLEIDTGSETKIQKVLSFRTVPVVQATAPRKFSAGFSWNGTLGPDEALLRLQDSMQFCGANFVLGGHAYFDTLSRRKIRRFAQLSTLLPQRGLCKYAELRRETFWQKRFIPAFRYADKKTTDLIGAADLGQKSGFSCLCPLCRAEFADFAPKLPQRRIMNLSAGQLQHYYGKELQAFRIARWQNLLEAVPLHLTDGKKKFVQTPRFWPLFSVLDSSPEIDHLKRLRRAAIRMTDPESLLLNEDLPRDLILYLMAEQTRQRFPKTELLALLPALPPDDLCSAQRTEFLLTGVWAAGFDGFCADLQQGADYRNYAGFAGVVKKLHPFEQWRKVSPEKAGIQVVCEAPPVPLPLLPASGRGVFPLPAEHSPIVAVCRQKENALLVLIGNFSYETQQCTVKAPGWTPAECTVDAAPQQWAFLKFRR